MRNVTRQSRSRRRLLSPPSWIAALLAGVLAVTMIPAAALADPIDGDGETEIGISKYISSPDEGVVSFSPGEVFTYTIELQCSALASAGCLNATLTDVIPAPLQLQSVSASPTGISRNDSDISANRAEIAFTQDLLDGKLGMIDGTVAQVFVQVRIPADITWMQAQELGEIVNTATFTADAERPLVADDTSTIVVSVPEELDVDATKTADDNMGISGRPIPAVPGHPVDFEIGGGNTSNRPVDTLTLTDPVAGSTNMLYLETSSIGPITAPAGADQVTVSYVDTDGATQTIGTFPTDVATVSLDGIDTATISQLVFTFSHSAGSQLPPATGPDDYASVGVSMVTTDAVSGLPEGTPVTVTNVVEATVSVDDRTATDTADDDVVIENVPPSVAVTKSFARNRLLPNESTVATLRADNGGKDVVELTIADPVAGQPDFAAQGLVFGGFTGAIEWPESAESVTIVYTLADGGTEEVTSTTADTLPPASDPSQVVGFAITYTGPIVAGAYAVTPFTVTAVPVDGDDAVTTTNTVESTVTDADGVVRDDTSEADITRVPLRVYTTVTKNIVQDEIYSRPGVGTTVNLAGKVNGEDDETAPSSVGSEYLIVQDPADPTDSDFWNHFDVVAIGPVDVPANATLEIEYYDTVAGEWTTFATSGPGTTYSGTFPEGLRDQAGGIRFVFEPAVEGELLQPGFNVITPYRAELRDELRDGTGPASGNDVTETIGNEASSTVENGDTGQGAVTDESDDDIELLPVDGDGPDMVAKDWVTSPVGALSKADTFATISWGTFGLPVDRMTITDPAGADTIGLAASVYDAFDLTAIGTIDASNDPAVRFDAVFVQRLTAAGTWVALGDGFTAAGPSLGGYPGYTLTDAERADTIGIRFVFTERADRASVITNPSTDPPVGSGVAATDGRDRHIPLTFTLRDFRRSAPANPVLGNSHVYEYNSGLPGVVDNTVHAFAEGPENFDSYADADMEIVDRPLNVSLTKRFVDYDENADDPFTDSEDVTEVGVPQAGTPQERFPIVTALLRATNESSTRIGTLTVTDPDPAETEDILRVFNLFRIADISVPDGADAALSVVTLSPAIGGQTEFTIDEAKLLTPAQLAGVLSVQVFHTGTPNAGGGFDSMIQPGAATTIRLEYQLRETDRQTEDPFTVGDLYVNHAITTATRPDLDGANQPIDLTQDARAADDLTLAEGTFGVTAAKCIGTLLACSDSYARTETQSADNYVVRLQGRPTGTVRTVEASLTDITPTFWNAFDFASFSAVPLARPVEQVRVDVLTGVDYDLSGSDLVQTCDGDADLTDCWTTGAWLSAIAIGPVVTAAQFNTAFAGLGIAPEEVQGLRYVFRRADGSNWERPSNPVLQGWFFVDRRETLRWDVGGVTDTPVPSTRPGLDPAPGETQAGHFSDDLVVDSVGSWEETPDTPWTATAGDDSETILTHVNNGISVTKVHGREASSTNRDTFAPGVEIPYSITVRNTGSWPITGLTLVDQVETDANGPMLVEPVRDFDDTTPIYTATRNGTALAGFSGSMDAGGLIAFVLPDGFVLAPNDALVITASLVFRQTPVPVDPGTRVDNGITATSDRHFDTCDYTTQGTWDRETAVETCSSSTEATPTAISPIATTKAVKGVGAGVEGAAPGDANYDDLGVVGVGVSNVATYCSAPNAGGGYYRSPCVPITRPGGTEEWRIQFTNNGNIPMTKVVSIDVLPALDDTGVILSGARQSRWRPIFTGSLSGNFDTEGGSLTTYYSTTVPNRACNEAEIQYLTGGIASGFAACTDEVVVQRPTMWLPYSESLSAEVKATIRALKFVGDFAASPLQPNDNVQLTFRTQTPWYADRAEQAASGVDPIAWNSFATGAVGTTVASDVQGPVVEPRKVGVAMATGQLRFVKDVDGASEDWGIEFPSSYAFALSCTSGGVPVPLVNAAGADMSQVRIAADGTPLVYNSGTGTWGTVNLPLYADCTLIEDDADPSSQGTVVTYDPVGADGSSGVVRALRFSYAANVVNPAPTGDPDLATIGALNTYLPGGFVVSKAVDDGGAVDQDGTAISYDEREFSFAATCTFLDQTVLDETFTLRAGDTEEFSGLPSGAECTVTETATADAAETSIVVTEDGVAGEPDTAAGTTFELLPYAEDTTTALTTAAFTNVYTVGAVEITKAIAGADQWADAAFMLAMTCTLDGVAPNPVYTGTATLSAPDDLVWTVGNLPTGAICVVTETQSGGANSNSAPIVLTVGDDPDQPVTGTITNTFTTGSLEVTKALSGAPAASLDPATEYEYEVSLSCTRQVNGATVAVAIPAGATRTITGAGTALYQGLPTGASCTLTESDAGHATSHTLDPTGPYTIGTGTTPIAVTLTNVFANGSVSVEKTVTAPEGFPVPVEFTATVSCTWQGAEVPLVDGGVVTLVEGAPVTIPNVPVGSICSVVEDDFGQVGAVMTPASITVAAADQTFALEIDNVYEWAALRVGKVVEADTENVPTGFEFHAVCTFQGETVLDETVRLNAGETHDFTELPARASCTVVETDTRGADDTVTSAAVEGATGATAPQIDQETRTVVIPELTPGEPADARNTVTYTNLFDTTALVVTKALQGAGAPQFGADKTFSVTVTCVFEGETILETTLELSAGNGWTATLTDVVAGSACQIAEDDLQGADAVVITPNDGDDTTIGTIEIPETGLVEVEVTNWYLTGSLEVTKTLTGDGVEKFGTGDFTLQLVCVRDGVEAVIPGGALRTVSADAPTAQYESLPSGAECTLTETGTGGANGSSILDAEGAPVAEATDGYTFTVVTDPTILSIDDQAQPALGVENTFHLAQVSVTKTVQTDAVDADGEPIAFGPFEVALSCLWNGQEVTAAEDMTQTLADGDGFTWTQLPQGAECSLTETDTADASSTSITVTTDETASDPVDGVVADLGPLPAVPSETVVAIMNTFDVASLTIAKVVDGAAAGTVTRTFPVEVRCVLVDASHPGAGLVVHDATYQVGGPDRRTATIENLPTGAECEVAEVDTGDAAQTTVTVDGETTVGTTATVVFAAGSAQVVFTNTFPGDLSASGGVFGWLIPMLAVLLIAAGGLLLVIRRRRTV